MGDEAWEVGIASSPGRSGMEIGPVGAQAQTGEMRLLLKHSKYFPLLPVVPLTQLSFA